MNIALRPCMTVDEFLAWEREQELRFELDGYQAVAMNGRTVLHSRIASGVARLLEDAMAGTDCLVLCGDVKISIAGRIRYLDVVVTSATVGNYADIAPNPVVVVEVLSSSTASVDRFDKDDEYR